MSQYGSVVRIGGFKSEPTDKHECLEVIWTQGSACKDCTIKCYRSGWSKQRATTNNKRMVKDNVRMY